MTLWPLAHPECTNFVICVTRTLSDIYNTSGKERLILREQYEFILSLSEMFLHMSTPAKFQKRPLCLLFKCYPESFVLTHRNVYVWSSWARISWWSHSLFTFCANFPSEPLLQVTAAAVSAVTVSCILLQGETWLLSAPSNSGVLMRGFYWLGNSRELGVIGDYLDLEILST